MQGECVCLCARDEKAFETDREREKGDILEVNYGEFKGRTSESK